MFEIGRVYDAPESRDSALGDAESRESVPFRVLVDRLWPRGLRKDRAALDLWARELAPSHDLRRALHAGTLDREAFAAQYIEELDAHPAARALADTLTQLAASGRVVCLLTATRAEKQVHVSVLRRWLEDMQSI